MDPWLAAILGFMVGVLFALKICEAPLDKARAKAKKYQNIVLFYEIVEKIRLVCAFRVKQIDESNRNEEVVTWRPEIYIGTSDFLKPVKTVTVMQKTFANDIEKVCDLLIDLEGDTCHITLKTPDGKEESFEIDKNEDSLFWLQLRDMIQPPVAILCDSKADEMFRKLREKKNSEGGVLN